MATAARRDLDGNPIGPMTICMIVAGGFVGSHLSEKLLAVDVCGDNVKHLLELTAAGGLPWDGRIQFHRLNIKHDSRLEGLVKIPDLTINLAAICTPAGYNTCPLDAIYSNFIDALPVDSDFYVLKEDASHCIFGSIEKQQWYYACAKQLIERLIYAEGAENGLEFTIGPFNCIGPRMEFIPGIDGPSEGVPRVLPCFSNENLARANGHIFNAGNPNNEVTVKQLAEMMTQVYSKVSGEPSLQVPTVDVSSKEFYGEGYDDSDKRIPDMAIINKQLGWNPKTSLWDLLESTLTYQYRTYAEAIKQAVAKPVAAS